MKVYRPIVTNRLTQKFGDNRACITPTGKIVSKQGNICPQGSKDFYKSIGMLGHNGFDFAAKHGETVYHAVDFEGRMKIEKDFHGGIGVDIISTKPVFLNGKNVYVKARYWHLKTPIGYDGKIVTLGTVIGLADNTGASSGDHLHLGLKECTAEGQTLNPVNNYGGCFDPAPYFTNVCANTVGRPLPLTAQELKEMYSQLSLAQSLLFKLKTLLK